MLCNRFRPQRLGHFAPLSFTAYGGKIQATRYAGGRWLNALEKPGFRGKLQFILSFLLDISGPEAFYLVFMLKRHWGGLWK